jgi:hypothetical protein
VLESEEGHGRRRPGQQTKDAEGWELRALAIENEMEEQRVKAEVGSCALAPLHKGVGVCGHVQLPVVCRCIGHLLGGSMMTRTHHLDPHCEDADSPATSTHT